MVGLTPKQTEDLNFAIQEYLLKKNYEETAKIFANEG